MIVRKCLASIFQECFVGWFPLLITDVNADYCGRLVNKLFGNRPFNHLIDYLFSADCTIGIIDGSDFVGIYNSDISVRDALSNSLHTTCTDPFAEGHYGGVK